MSYNLTGAAYGGNVALSKAGLAATNAAATYSTANTLTFAIKGQLYSQAAIAAAAPPATDAISGKAWVPLNPNETCIFAFFINAAGALSVAQGPKVSTLDFTGGLAAAQFPQADDTRTPIGYLLVSTTAALVGTWTFGTSNNSGVTGLNAIVARDMMDYPAQPIVA